MNRSIILLAILLLILPGLQTSQAKGTAEESAQGTVAVTVRPLPEVLFTRRLDARAEVIALNHAQVSAQASGEVLEIAAEAGESVAAGALLVRLDCRQSEFNLAVLTAAWELARKEFERAQPLRKKNTISDQEMTRVSASLEQATVRKQEAALAVEHCLIKAPFSGVITERQAQLGALLTPGAPVLKLLQSDAVEVKAWLDNQALAGFQAAGSIQFVAAAQSWPLRIRSVIPLLDEQSGKQVVRLSVIGQPPLPGMPGQVVWDAPGKYLPAELVVERAGKYGYFTARDGVAHFNPLPDVQPGHPARVELAEGQAAGVSVVIDGRFRLEEGDPVEAQSSLEEDR